MGLENVSTGPAPIQIAGIEQTQAIQYFAFNNQGTRLDTDNSLPLISGKSTVLRVYPGYTEAAEWLDIQAVTGRVVYQGSDDRVCEVAPLNLYDWPF